MNTCAQQAIDAMRSIVSRHSIEITKHYPEDLECDADHLSKRCCPGLSFGWCIGHYHSHLVLLGLHPSASDTLSLSRLSSEDLYWHFTFSGTGRMRVRQLSRETFGQLGRNTPIPYRSRALNAQTFALQNDNKSVAEITLRSVGSVCRPVVDASIVHLPNASEKDSVAAVVWAHREAARLVGTLFVRTNVTEQRRPLNLAA